MSLNKRKLSAVGGVVAISLLTTACAESDLDSAGRSAGDSLNRSGQLGVATAINTGQQVIPTEEMLRNLTRMFGAEVPATINFEFNSSELDDAARSALDAQAQWIISHPAVKFRVYGHTDKVGSNAYNIALGKRRADAAVAYLVSRGVPRNRLEGVASFGETRPVVFTQGRSRANRRTVTEVIAFVKPFDGDLDGKYARNVYDLYVSRYQRIAQGQRTFNEGTGGAQ
ncbi:MAG: OmpA family protein [Pseudomonadota bacterium]